MTFGASLAFARAELWVELLSPTLRSWWSSSWTSFNLFFFFCYPFIFTRSFHSALSYKFILKTWWDLINLLHFVCLSLSAKLRQCLGSWIRCRYLGAGSNRGLQCKLHMINANWRLDGGFVAKLVKCAKLEVCDVQNVFKKFKRSWFAWNSDETFPFQFETQIPEFSKCIGV